MEIARRLEGENIDLLLIHETPYLPQLFPFMARDFRSETVYEAIKTIKPKLVVNGHMHSNGYKVYDFPWGTRYIYVSSDQRERHYLVLNTGSNIKIEVWKDNEKTTSWKHGCIHNHSK